MRNLLVVFFTLFSQISYAEFNACPKVPIAVATSHNWVSAITASSATTLSQPAFTDISGSLPNSQLAAMADQTIKGNISGGSATPSDLTATQATAFLNNFSSSLKGTVPGSGGGTSNYLRADGTWAAPTGTGVTSVQVAGTNGLSFSGGPITTTGTITASLTAPTIQKLVANPTGVANYSFTITSGNTASVGAVYTNNGSSFTLLKAMLVGDTTIYASGTGTPAASGTLTYSSGTHTGGNLTFSAFAGTYVLPANVLYIVVEAMGAGGGGAGSGPGFVAGGNGGNSTFGISLINGGGGTGSSNLNGAAGGTASLGSGPIGIALVGGTGGGGYNTAGGSPGGDGGNGVFGGGGGGGNGGGGVGNAGATNTGGGGGAGGFSGANQSQGGGGSGGYVRGLISSPSSFYTWNCGVAGTAGTAGTLGANGALGGSGVVIVTEYYQ